MPNVINYKDVDIDKIVFSKGEFSGGFKNISISYKKNNSGDESISKSELIVQGPRMTIPFGISSYDEKNNSNYMDLSFGDLSEDLEILYELIDNIGKKCKRKRKKWKLDGQQFSENIKNTSRLYPPLLRIKIPTLNNNFHFNVFDDSRNKLNHDQISPNSICTPILHIKNVWINNDNYGINIQLLQLKIHLLKILEDYSFLDDDNYNNTSNSNMTNSNNKDIQINDKYPKLKDHPIYGTYFKMLRLKIPKESVQSKMKFDGHHDLTILDLDENKSLEIQTKKEIENITTNINANDLISGFNNLKKKKPVEKKITISNHIGPPTQSELINALKNLKNSK